MKSELSDGEWTLMNQVWDAPYSTITELTNALRQETGWDKHTILSMLSRLEKKGAAAYREGGRAKEFYGVLSREEALRRETERFLEKAGGLSRLGRALREGLSREDRAELARILGEAGPASDRPDSGRQASDRRASNGPDSGSQDTTGPDSGR